MIPRPGLWVALDTTDRDRAVALARTIRPHVAGIKLGLEFFLAQGAAGYLAVADLGLPIFLDLKCHDIPNTVAGAMRAVAPLAPAIVTIHAGGGTAMMVAAAVALRESTATGGKAPPRIVGVTVLTSLDAEDLAATGQIGSPRDQARRLARLAQEAGLDGVVCSPDEIRDLRQDCGKDFLLVVPGLRPAGTEIGDQKRVMTPREAALAGADVLVIGRPITAAADPAAAARAIAADLPRQ